MQSFLTSILSVSFSLVFSLPLVAMAPENGVESLAGDMFINLPKDAHGVIIEQLIHATDAPEQALENMRTYALVCRRFAYCHKANIGGAMQAYARRFKTDFIDPVAILVANRHAKEWYCRQGLQLDNARVFPDGIPAELNPQSDPDVLLKAVYEHDLSSDQVRQYLFAGVDPNRGYEKNLPEDVSAGTTLLHLAALYRRTDLAALYLACGARVDKKNQDGLQPVHIAACTEDGNPKRPILKTLLQAGADIEATTNEGTTPLAYAIEGSGRAYYSENAVSTLLKAGANASRAEGEQQLQPLHRAAKRGYTELIRPLLRAGAKVNVLDRDGHTPLFMAVHGLWWKTVQELLAVGANQYVAPFQGEHADITPLAHIRCVIPDDYNKRAELVFGLRAGLSHIEQQVQEITDHYAPSEASLDQRFGSLRQIQSDLQEHRPHSITEVPSVLARIVTSFRDPLDALCLAQTILNCNKQLRDGHEPTYTMAKEMETVFGVNSEVVRVLLLPPSNRELPEDIVQRTEIPERCCPMICDSLCREHFGAALAYLMYENYLHEGRSKIDKVCMAQKALIEAIKQYNVVGVDLLCRILGSRVGPAVLYCSDEFRDFSNKNPEKQEMLRYLARFCLESCHNYLRDASQRSLPNETVSRDQWLAFRDRPLHDWLSFFERFCPPSTVIHASQNVIHMPYEILARIVASPQNPYDAVSCARSLVQCTRSSHQDYRLKMKLADQIAHKFGIRSEVVSLFFLRPYIIGGKKLRGNASCVFFMSEQVRASISGMSHELFGRAWEPYLALTHLLYNHAYRASDDCERHSDALLVARNALIEAIKRDASVEAQLLCRALGFRADPSISYCYNDLRWNPKTDMLNCLAPFAGTVPTIHSLLKSREGCPKSFSDERR